MEDHTVDLISPTRQGPSSAPQEQSDWGSRRGRIQIKLFKNEH